MDAYKLTFSQLFFENLRPEEKLWIKCIFALDTKRHAATILENMPGVDLRYGWPGFVGQILEDPAHGISCLWVHSEQSFSPGNVVAFLRAFIAEHRPTAVVSFTWAIICSRPLAGEFGGGWAAVSATRCVFGETWAGAAEAVKKLKAG
jgi:hypothetical protein